MPKFYTTITNAYAWLVWVNSDDPVRVLLNYPFALISALLCVGSLAMLGLSIFEPLLWFEQLALLIMTTTLAVAWLLTRNGSVMGIWLVTLASLGASVLWMSARNTAFTPTAVPAVLLLPCIIAAFAGARSCGLACVLTIIIRAAVSYSAHQSEHLIVEALFWHSFVIVPGAGMLMCLSAFFARSIQAQTFAYEQTLLGWARALDLRDHDTEGHSQRVTLLTIELARTMGIAAGDIVHIRRGALLHDIGKMGVPDNILLKPGRLSEEEWVIMRRHPTFACELLRPISFLSKALPIPCHHHEKWDGTGYPQGLRGEAIPLAARIFAVVDAWDALTNDRVYRRALTVAGARAELLRGREHAFDPRVLDVFLQMSVTV